MKRLFWLALFAVAAWYGWNHRDALMQPRGQHEAVVTNGSGHTMTRVRLTVDGQTLVKEELPDGGTARFPFKNANESTFRMVWQWTDRVGDAHWEGGLAAKTDVLQRYVFDVRDDNQVTFRAEALPAKP